MLRKWWRSYNPFSVLGLFRLVRPFNTCPLPVEPSISSVPAIPIDHRSLIFSLADQLIRRGLLPSARQVIHRFILRCLTVPEAISAVDFALRRGMELDTSSYGVLIQKLCDYRETQMAEALYNDAITTRGIDPDPLILNSLLICYCKLGRFEEAKSHFDTILESKSMPSKVAACKKLLRQLCAQYRFNEAFEFFVKIDNAGILLGFWFYNTIIDGLCSSGYFNKALHVFDKMCKRGIPPTIHLCKSLFFGFRNSNQVMESELVINKMLFYNLPLDNFVYNSLIHVYSKNKKMKMAMRVFFRMLKTGFDPDNYTYNSLIYGFVKLGLFNKGWILHNQMVEFGLKPDVATYNIMMNQYCKMKKIDCALMVLDSMSRFNTTPSVQCYTVLIDALLKDKRLIEVDELYHKMLNNGVLPDHVLFFTLFKTCPKGHELDLALLFLQALAKNGCGISNFNCFGDVKIKIEGILDEIVQKNPSLGELGFGIYLMVLSLGGKSDEALLCMDKMVSINIKPLSSAFNSLIKCLFQDNLVNDAESLIEIMQEHEIVPDITTYSIMINEHCNKGDLGSAFDVLDRMNERGLKPSVADYNSIIRCLSREKRIFEAEIMFERMIKAGVEPDNTLYETIIDAYSKNGWEIRAIDLFDKMLKHGIRSSFHAYTSLIHGLVKKNMIEKACLYLDMMIEDGFMPNKVFYTSLINQFLMNKEFEFAFRLLDLMEKSKIEPDFITCIGLMSGVSKNISCVNGKWRAMQQKHEKQKEMFFDLLRKSVSVPSEHTIKISIQSVEEMKIFALKIIRKVKKTPFMPNLYLYNCMISLFCEVDMIDEAYKHVELMQWEGLIPNLVTFTVLINGHFRSGETERAVWLFNKMNENGVSPDRILYNRMIVGLSKAGRIIDALSLLQAMGKRGISPCKNTYENLLNGLCIGEFSIQAVSLCEDMVAVGYTPCRYNLKFVNRLHENGVFT